MRVVVPFTRQHDEVAAALDETGHAWERVDVSGSDEAYWQLLSDLWRASKTFAIVEHDIAVRPDTLQEFEECQAPWCAFEVPYVGTVWAGLSCVRFRGELIARHPDALERVAELSDGTHPVKHWCRLDAWLQGTLLSAGEQRCTHSPPLTHLRDYVGPPSPSHACG